MDVNTRRRNALHFFGLVLAVVAGAVVGLLLLPLLWKVSTSDLGRLETLHDALDRGPSPSIAVLGSSVVMNGVDGNLLQDLVPGKPDAWNLGSPGQIPFESMLIADQLGTSTSLVVLTVSVTELTTDVANIDPRKYGAYYAYGFRPSTETVQIAQRVGAAETVALFDQPWWKALLGSRWITRSMMDTAARKLLRPDLDLERARTDLRYPAPFRETVDTEVLAKLLRENMPERFGDGTLSESQTVALELMVDELRRRGIETVVMVPPEHPDFIERTTDDFYRTFDADLANLADALGLSILNARDLLPAQRFIDHVHPDADGARMLTSLIAERIAELSEANR